MRLDAERGGQWIGSSGDDPHDGTATSEMAAGETAGIEMATSEMPVPLALLPH